MHQLEQLNVLKKILVMVVDPNPDFSGPIEQAPGQFQVVAGDDIARRQGVAHIEQDLFLGQVGVQRGFHLPHGQTELSRGFGHDLPPVAGVKEVGLVRDRTLAK